MEEIKTEKKQRGGARTGAGRKRRAVKSYMVYATQEVYDILEAVEGSRSDFICRCILDYAARHDEDEEVL